MKGGLFLNEMGRVLLSTPTEREQGRESTKERRESITKMVKEDRAQRDADGEI